MTKPNLSIIIALFLSIVLQGWAQDGGASEMYAYITRFEADENALMRKYPLKESKEYYDRFSRLYDEWEAELGSIDFTKLSLQGQADHILLRNCIARRDYFLQGEYVQFKSIQHVLQPIESLYDFLSLRRHGDVPSYEQLSQTFDNIPAQLEKLQNELKDHPFDNWIQADKAKMAVILLHENLKEAYAFYNSYDPLFTWWMQMPYATLDQAMITYADFLGKNYSANAIKDDGSGILGKPIGREAILKSLEFSFIAYSPEQLIEAAEEQFVYCEKEMLRAAEELGFGKDWKAALEHVKNTYVSPGEQPRMIDSLAWEAINFITKRDLITVPDLAIETWRMNMMSPERQRVNPFFTGGEAITISYPTASMSHDDKMMSMRGNNPNFSTATVHHELIPGHHLQQFMNARHRPYRKLFSTPFWGEGWALYWEILLWNKNFPDTPEERIGMLFWRMHRCARIIFSLGFHLDQMTPQQCIDLLVNRVGHEYANAEAEVRRSFATSYEPLYQLAYMVGGLQFYALRTEMLEAGWTEKEYHDAVMQQGNIPVEILRVLLKEGSFEKDFRTNWKFSTAFQ